MDSVDFVAVLSRWVHVGTAIVLVGGTIFLRFILMPAAAQLPDAEHTALRERIMSRWKFIVHTGVLFFLLSGFYNYLVVTRPLHKGDGLYHALIGMKILMALVVFFVAIALTGRSAATEVFRRNARTWLMVNVVLATLIVAISGFLKVRPLPAAAEDAPAVTQIQPELPSRAD